MTTNKAQLAASKFVVAVLYITPLAVAFGLELAALAAIGVLR
jgi:hypothetical protein